jgi:hypothetical protein
MPTMAMTLRLTETETEALRRVAERENRSMQEVAREAVVRYTSDRDRLRDDALARIGTDWRGVFDRLAET